MTDDMRDRAHLSARAVFAGLVPNNPLGSDPAHSVAQRDRPRMPKAVYTTVPLALVGSMAAMTLNLTGPVQSAEAQPTRTPGDAASDSRPRLQPKPAAAASVRQRSSAMVPRTYIVVAGDTIMDVADRFSLSTASVLALNGLSWSSLIFPGQELTLSSALSAKPGETGEPGDDGLSAGGRYTIAQGDTVKAIADRFGISAVSVLMANGLGWSSIIYPGQTLVIPGRDGHDTPAAAPKRQSPDSRSDTPSEDANEALPVDAAGPAENTDTAGANPEPPAAPPAPTPVNGTYTIVSGDTISKIASRFGITTQALLDANGLTASSLIFPGRILVIPGITTASSGGPVTVLNDEMRANAAVIVQTGRNLGVPDYGIVIALAAAMQESSLRNISWGDLDSVGLFQQRPSAGWGSIEQLTTPEYAARLFYGGPSNPNRGRTRGLLDIPGWQSMTVTRAAQSVQVSAYPNAYAKWETSARAWLAELG
jgi:LysM repeat protein